MSELFALFAGGAPGDDPAAADGPGDVPRDDEVSTLLSSPDRRARMAAYAYLYANPDPGWIGELIDAVNTEDARFGQYWGVRTLRRLVEAAPAVLDAPTRRRLEQLAATFDPDTDGADDLRDLLREMPA
jgi:hypothetical protein